MNVAGNRALFLDRDGVINHDSGYTSNSEDFRFIDGIFDLCRAARQSGYLLIVVTNQAGIGRGYYTEQDFFFLSEWMRQRFVEEGAPITDIFHCPYHPEHGIGLYKKDSFNRKPHPGMLLQAAEKHEIDMAHSIMIGDKDSDMQAAKNARVGVRCHYSTPKNHDELSSSATCGIRALHEAIPILTHL